ncbi:MAG TPA: hypothetical protein DCQ32_08235 [Cyanobacteria bacterium UBA8156]|jgi:hypothetical protein|nr:hypothetical protein [Cyanobacteria bacterium UBA8156]
MLKQIIADIAELERAIATVEDRLVILEKAYLQAICQSTRQQLLMAAYRLCTQVHPREFLALSVGDREKVQDQLRAIANQAAEQCQGLMAAALGDSLEEKLSQVLAAASAAVAQCLQGAEVLPDEKGAHPLHLRLADVEFGDREAMGYRSEMRVARARRQYLGDELRKKQQQKTVAEAELAWRATWVEP